MASKNGRAELVSLLQYMKKSELDNPEIMVQDERILNLNRIVEEVKASEEWEDARMSIYSVGIEEGERQAKIDTILRLLKENGSVPKRLENRIQKETNEECLYKWIKMAAKVDSVKMFEQMMDG